MKRLVVMTCWLVLSSLCPYMCAADNPTPCTASWVCSQNPDALPTWNKLPFKGCLGIPLYFEAAAYPSNGTRVRCDESKNDVTTGPLSWTWIVTGPVPSSGNGNSTTITPTKCGTYNIQFTVAGTGDAPCSNIIYNSTDNPSFIISCESCSASGPTTDQKICPDACTDIPLTITNPDPDCTFTFHYDTTLADGPPHFRTLGGTGSVTLGPGQSTVVTFTVCADPDSAAGSQKFTMKVYGTYDPSAHCEVSGTASLDTGGQLGTNSQRICPGADGDAATVTNPTKCTMHYTWTAQGQDGAGKPSVSFSKSGSLDLGPGLSAPIVHCTVSLDSARGDDPITITLYDEDGNQLGQGVAVISVPFPQGTIRWEHPYTPPDCLKIKAGSPKIYPLYYSVTNTGDCKEGYHWTITASGPIHITGAGTTGNGHTTKAPHQSGRFAIRVSVPDSEDIHAGTVIILEKLFSDATGQTLDSSTTCITILKCEAPAPITQKISLEKEIPKFQKIVDNLNEILEEVQKFAKRWPGGKVTVDKVAIHGTLSYTTGKECCPGYDEPTKFQQYGGSGSITSGITFSVGPEWELEPKSFTDPISGVGVVLEGKAEATISGFVKGAGSIGIFGHQGACQNCYYVEGNVGITPGVKGALGGHLDFTLFQEVDGVFKEIEKLELKAEGEGVLKGNLSLGGRLYFGSECEEKNTFKVCGGPLKFEIGVSVELPLFGSTYTLSWSPKEFDLTGSFGDCSE